MPEQDESHISIRTIGRFITITALIVISILLLLSVHIPTESAEISVVRKDIAGEALPSNQTVLAIPFVQEHVQQQEAQKRAALVEQQLQQQTQRVSTFFNRYGAVMSGYEDILVRQAHACGGDYRVLVGIAGNESGLGRIPYKLYNPFGYLDGVQYASWEEALTILSCKISREFLVPCNNNLYCIIQRYGGSETNQEQWIKNVTWFMNQV